MGHKKPHILGIDDGPFDKKQAAPVPIVGIMMEGATLVEGIAIGQFPVDGEGATEFLMGWVKSQRWLASLQAVILGGVTVAGLGVVDIGALAAAIETPVMAVTRQDTAESTLAEALRSAGLDNRLALLDRTPPARRVADGLYVACAGVDFEGAVRLVRASCGKARIPEPLRIAHLFATALVEGTSRGRA